MTTFRRRLATMPPLSRPRWLTLTNTALLMILMGGLSYTWEVAIPVWRHPVGFWIALVLTTLCGLVVLVLVVYSWKRGK